MKRKVFNKCLTGFFILFLFCSDLVVAQQVDFSVVSVAEEASNELIKITSNSDCVCMPVVKRNRMGVEWLSNRILGISVDGKQLAYLSARNNATNIFLKDIDKQGSSVQRTNRQAVMDFSFSPDGKSICFSEQRGKNNQIFVTDAKSGYVCRQITSGAVDYSPNYSSDQKQIFFARQENNSISIWSYSTTNNFLSTYTSGMNPYSIKGESAYFCVRASGTGKSEIWKVNYQSGTEECVVSDPNRSFTSPSVSPDGNWLLFVGSSKIENGNVIYWNTDLYVCHLDGSDFAQLTYHAADDVSPVWSKDGKYIYFISQRGDAEGVANVWRMTFNY